MYLSGAARIPNLIIRLDTATLLTALHWFSRGIWILLQQLPKTQLGQDTSLTGQAAQCWNYKLPHAWCLVLGEHCCVPLKFIQGAVPEIPVAAWGPSAWTGNNRPKHSRLCRTRAPFSTIIFWSHLFSKLPPCFHVGPCAHRYPSHLHLPKSAWPFESAQMLPSPGNQKLTAHCTR